MPTKPWFPTYINQQPLKGKGSEMVARSLLGACRGVRRQDHGGRLWCKANYPDGYTSYGTMRSLNRTHPPFTGSGNPKGTQRPGRDMRAMRSAAPG